MSDYRIVSRPAALKPLEVSAEELAALAEHAEGAVGLDGIGEAGPRQLEMWWRDGKTFVKPIAGPAGLQPWALTGKINGFDVRDHFYAVIAPTLTKED